MGEFVGAGREDLDRTSHLAWVCQITADVTSSEASGGVAAFAWDSVLGTMGIIVLRH